MRIVAGKWKGTALASVGSGDPSRQLRPTTDRMRETVFNLLAHGGYGNPVEDARVLDLFAGTGALGFEALSRGAQSVLFVDDGAKSRALIRQNMDILRAIGSAKLFRRDATKLGEVTGKPFDLVFLDPPYGKDLGPVALSAAARGGWLNSGAICVLEDNNPQALPEGFTLHDERKYGDTVLHIAEYTP